MADPKSAQAFRTIGELAAELGLQQHILRYWETRFPQLRPLTRAGNRRYYRPEDVALVRRIDKALNRDGYTIRGVQNLLNGPAVLEDPARAIDASPIAPPVISNEMLSSLSRIRDSLKAALAE